MDTFTTSTSNCEVTYVYEEMVTVTVGGFQMTMPKRVLTTMLAIGQGLMLDQMQKGSQ